MEQVTKTLALTLFFTTFAANVMNWLPFYAKLHFTTILFYLQSVQRSEIPLPDITNHKKFHV